ncbi:MAG: type 1 glutamine amidotransferase [Planctomycetes bacterium]|nr:type 1 glutamine amidotransferase [Planctomycetota bacterium]
MPGGPKYLVIDGYTKEARDQLVSGGASMASDLYQNMLIKCSPPGAECDVLFPSDKGTSFPSDEQLESYDGIAWTGCSSCLNDTHLPEITQQIDLTRRAFEAGVPSFGSCWAAQIAVVAAGGQVQPNPNGREMGIARKIELTPAGRAHPMYEGKTSVFDAFTSHDDEITHLPPGAVVLSRNPWTQVQSIAVTYQGGTFWGLQYHPEYDLHELARLAFCRIPKLINHGFFRDEPTALQFIDDLENLHLDHGRKDIAWKLGIDADVMNDDVRLCEVRNWVNRLVLPKMK